MLIWHFTILYNVYIIYNGTAWPYAVKPQTSLAPLSQFRGSRVTTAHVHQCCIFQSYAKTVPFANEIDYEIDDAWTNIHGTHDNGPHDHSVWRLTLTAYYECKYLKNMCHTLFNVFCTFLCEFLQELHTIHIYRVHLTFLPHLVLISFVTFFVWIYTKPRLHHTIQWK